MEAEIEDFIDASAQLRMLFVSITRVQVRSWRYVPAFLVQSIRGHRWRCRECRPPASTGPS